MPLAKNVMHGGVSAGQAQAINGNTINSAVTAAGTTQGTATPIVADVNAVTTATSLQGVILYDGMIGDDQWVYNGVANTPIYLYPPVGDSLNQLAVNSGMVLAPYTGVFCKKVTSVIWLANLSA